MGCAFEVLNELGHGLLEKPYENALVVEFGLRSTMPKDKTHLLHLNPIRVHQSIRGSNAAAYELTETEKRDLILMRDLLASDGSISVHCDWRGTAYIRNILDEIFGKNFFQSEIMWKRVFTAIFGA